jgi:uncharacterized protein (TIGR02996 family)
MTEREALLAAVCANPDDDTPRLVFADWLEENGEPERAEFIRLQCELAGGLPPGPERSALVSRSHKLLREHESQWRAGLFEIEPMAWQWDLFERGFVESLLVYDADRFSRFASRLFASSPILTLTFFAIKDPGALADIPALSRVRHLSIWTNWPTADSVRRLACATNLKALDEIAILGPTIDFALEDLLVERFGPKLHRGI